MAIFLLYCLKGFSDREIQALKDFCEVSKEAGALGGTYVLCISSIGGAGRKRIIDQMDRSDFEISAVQDPDELPKKFAGIIHDRGMREAYAA